MGESGFLIPSQYANSQNPDDAQLLHLANAESDSLRDLGLVQLRDSASIILTTDTDYALPEDFYSYISDTAYSGNHAADLPTSPQAWTLLNAFGGAGPQHRVRFIGDRVHVMEPVAGETITYEYLSAYPWRAGSVNQELATADTDEWRLDRRLLVMGVKWRWKKEKGMEDWQADFAAYQKYVSTVRGRNEGAKTLFFGECGEYIPHPYTDTYIR